MNKKHSGRTCKDTAWSGLLFLCLLFFCFAEIAAAQTNHTFKGRVIENDAYRTPLYGATIYFPELETGTTTNLSGYFTLEDLPEGSTGCGFRLWGISHRNTPCRSQRMKNRFLHWTWTPGCWVNWRYWPMRKHPLKCSRPG